MGQYEVLQYLKDKDYFVNIKEIDKNTGSTTAFNSIKKLLKSKEIVRIKVKDRCWWEYRYMSTENYDKLPQKEKKKYTLSHTLQGVATPKKKG